MMRSLIVPLIILCAISGSDLILNCLKCKAKNSDTCEGVSVECPDSDECLVTSELYHAKETVYHSIEKGCNNGSSCNTQYYISNFVDKELRMNIQCCSEDNCNTGGYEMPLEQKKHKGRTCTSCYGDGMVECISDRKVRCLNEEDKCLDFIGRLRDPGNDIQEHNLKGCISPSACISKFKGMISVEEIQTDRFDCSD